MESHSLLEISFFVSKMQYGTRIPRPVIQMPTYPSEYLGTRIPSYSDRNSAPYYRLPGFQMVEGENDVVYLIIPGRIQYPHRLNSTNYIKAELSVSHGESIDVTN